MFSHDSWQAPCRLRQDDACALPGQRRGPAEHHPDGRLQHLCQGLQRAHGAGRAHARSHSGEPDAGRARSSSTTRRSWAAMARRRARGRTLWSSGTWVRASTRGLPPPARIASRAQKLRTPSRAAAGGHERYKSLRSIFYSELNGVIIVHDQAAHRCAPRRRAPRAVAQPARPA